MHESINIKLTPAQKREYEFLQKHGSAYIADGNRKIVFEKLVEKGLATHDSTYWYHLK